MAQQDTLPSPPKKYTVYLGLGLLALAIGFLAPRFLTPTATPVEKPAEAVQDFSLPQPSADAPSLGLSLFKMVLGIAVVSGGCIGIARFLKKSKGVPILGDMAVVARLALDRRCVLHLVQCGERRLLLGLDASGAKALLEIPGSVPAESVSSIGPNSNRFAAVLARAG